MERSTEKKGLLMPRRCYARDFLAWRWPTDGFGNLSYGAGDYVAALTDHGLSLLLAFTCRRSHLSITLVSLHGASLFDH
ncbi:hypothetical protein CRG98_012711 [Punica granatum]|uniref:Uncharacterized protein n=1 Tax=Punica granatum TaxID=22663 RepID=A0A2I0KEM3_PUNGR|nr:hypothetical protein CRG98_012711 [Punica granatum]